MGGFRESLSPAADEILARTEQRFGAVEGFISRDACIAKRKKEFEGSA